MSASAPAAGLCATCRHAELLASRRSRFLRCRRSFEDAAFARYPSLPVLSCAGYEAEVDAPPRGGDGPALR